MLDRDERPPTANEIRDLVDDLNVARLDLSKTVNQAMALTDRIVEVILLLIRASRPEK